MLPRLCLASFVVTVVVVVFQLVANQPSSCSAQSTGDVYYQVPNPFPSKPSGYYAIQSFQTAHSLREKKTLVEVDEYFSLASGLSFSIHRNRDDLSQAYALISDGPRGKSYIVRNPEADDTQELDCELDHLHHHRKVFPWQYVYTPGDGAAAAAQAETEEAGADGAKKGARKKRAKKDKSGGDDDRTNSTTTISGNKKKTRWSTQRFIYGVGAIWLNAIERKIVSNEVGDDSPYATANLWVMNEGDQKIELMFTKPDAKTTQAADMGRLLEGTQLQGVLIKRENVLDHEHDLGGMGVAAKETQEIVVRSFEPVKISQDSKLKRFFGQLAKCRADNKKHRLFPSLMRALSLSPQRLYFIDYIQKKFPLAHDGAGVSDGRFDKKQHRRVWANEFHSEWFSLRREAQSNLYESVDTEAAAKLPDPEGALEVDVFMRLFSGKERAISSRHSTAYWHMVEKSGRWISCKEGQAEPMPSDHLFIRPVHFTRSDGKQLSGFLIGLGALIMNAADAHYKEFSLFQKDIDVVYDANDLQATMRMRVNEWQFYDKKTKRTIHFYFKSKPNEHDQHEIDDLVRVDIRDATAHEANEDDAKDYDMLVRYDIIGIHLEASEDEIELMFVPPPICHGGGGGDGSTHGDGPGQLDDDDGDGSAGGGDDTSDDGGFYFDDDHYNEFSDAEHGDTSDLEQFEGEEFEFEPGKLVESFDFPDFFDFLDGQPTYRIVSQIEILADNDDAQNDDDLRRRRPIEVAAGRKFIYLAEQVDLEQELASYSIYESAGALEQDKPLVVFHINYNTELIFRIDGHNSDHCAFVDEVEPWLRLLSAKIKYYRSDTAGGATKNSTDADRATLMFESSNLLLYGVGALWREASDSAYSEFVGVRKETVVKEGKHFKQVLWSLADDGDDDMVLAFNFLMDMERAQDDTNRRRSRRASELLQLDSVYVSELLANEWDTGFQKFRLYVNEFSTAPSKKGAWPLPASCQRALAEAAQREAAQSKWMRQTEALPSFANYILPSNAYSFHYKVTHLLPGDTGLPGESRVSVIPISEYYDLNLNRGKLTVGSGPDVREIFIDGAGRAIYYYLDYTNTCKRITSINSLVDLEPALATENDDFSTDKMYGLAGLWIKLASMKKTMLKVSKRYDHLGNAVELRTYRIAGQLLSAAATPADPLRPTRKGTTFSKETSYNVYVTFASKPAPLASDTWVPGHIKVRTESEFELESINFVPSLVKPNTAFADFHRASINVVESSRESPVGWALPDECERLALADRPDVKFPKMDWVRLTNQFYMRSEITTSQPAAGEQVKLYLMDEWLYHHNIRTKTYGLNKNLDLVIYAETDESFDISTPYLCPLNVLPKFEVSKGRPKSKLVAFWKDNETLVDELAHLYYGPVAMWRLAEKNLANVKLANLVDIAPRPSSGDAAHTSAGDLQGDVLEREMRTEVWRVTSPQGSTGGKGGSWSYDMEFSKHSTIDEQTGQVREWSVLERITNIVDTKYLDMKQTVEVEVINYRYDQPDSEVLERFLLPEGYGCTRSEKTLAELRQTQDDLAVDLEKEYWLWYEASLELVEESRVDIELGALEMTRTVLPTVMGSYVRSARPTLDLAMNIYAHNSKIRFLNGSMSSTKTVFDSSNSIVFTMDRMTGVCFVNKDLKKDWLLQFPVESRPQQQQQQSGASSGDDRIETVTMSEPLFRLLFTMTADQNYLPINRYGRDDYFVSTYEHSYDKLKLTETFEGPATVIRRYENLRSVGVESRFVEATGTSTKLHESVHVKVLMFDTDRKQVKAILSISLRQIYNTDLAEVVRATNVAPCYAESDPLVGRGMGSFAIEYHIESTPAAVWARHNTGQLEEQFLKLLIRSAKVLPIQLNGVPRVEFGHTNQQLMKIYFNLLDSPTSIEFFVRRWHYRMTAKMELRAELKLAASLAECSKWCDQVGCLAMSYCADRTCRVLTPNMLEGRRNDGSLTSENLSELTSCESDNDCDYFFTIMRPTTLAGFASSVGLIINEQREVKKLAPFALTVAGDRPIVPARFQEFKDDFGWESEDLGLSSTDASGTDVRDVFVTIERDHRLKTHELDEIARKYKLSTTFEHAHSYAECLEKCKTTNCIMLGHCKTDSSCVMVSGKIDLKRLEPAFEPDQQGCTISVRDFLAGYTRFTSTAVPKTFEKQLEGYSALECAALCLAADGEGDDKDKFSCLSFDSCRSNARTATTTSSSSAPMIDADRPVCYLQKVHVMLDSFDRSILAPEWHDLNRSKTSQGESGLAGLACDHYSKSVLADFHLIPNRKLETKINSVVRGLNAERCAVECQQDEDCRAFEYCFNDKRQPVQACYFIRVNETTSSGKESAASIGDWNKHLEEHLKASKKCSIYTMRHFAEQYAMDAKSHSLFLIDNANELLAKHGHLLQNLSIALGCISASIIVGTVIQIGYIRLFGRPIIFNN